MIPIGTVKIIINGRITIPQEFRKKYSWKEGNLLMVYDNNGKLAIEKIE